MHTACRLATGLALASALCAPVYAQQDPHGSGEQPHIDPLYAGLPPPPEAMERAYVVLYELLYGAEKSQNPAKTRREVEHFAARLSVLPFDDAAAAHTAEIRADLERHGCTIGPYDLMIAGHARSNGLIVVTGNLREFTRVTGLRCEDWTDS